MKAKQLLLLIVLLAVVLVLAFVPAALAKGQTAEASGSWTWVGNEDDWVKFIPPQAPTPSGRIHITLHGSETGQWTGTFEASDTYESYVAMIMIEVPYPGGYEAKLWIHFKDATVDMGQLSLHGDMTMLVIFHHATTNEGATWKILNGTGDLQYLGGAGTLVWVVPGVEMEYSGTITYNK